MFEGVGGGYRDRLYVLSWNIQAHTTLNYLRYAGTVNELAMGRYGFLIILTTNLDVFCNLWLKVP